MGGFAVGELGGWRVRRLNGFADGRLGGWRGLGWGHIVVV